MPKSSQAFGDRCVCPRIGLYWFGVIVMLCGPFGLGSGSTAGTNEEADRFGILSPPEKAAAPDFTLEDPSGTQVSAMQASQTSNIGPTAYVCAGTTCSLPTTEPEAVATLVKTFQQRGH